MKLLRKSRGKWIAVTSGIGLVASLALADHVSAQTEQPPSVEQSSVVETENSENEVPVSNSMPVSVTEPTLPEVEVADETVVVAEQQAAVAEITSTWQANTVPNIEQEIERQEALKLPEYVVQWGDTLSTIAAASNTTVDELVTLNQIANRDLIFTGQLLKGVLYQQNAINAAGSSDLLLERERQASRQKIKSTWTLNCDDTVKHEIARQEKLELSVYVIQWGDTLGTIARASGTTVAELARLNQIQNVNLIITGNTLKGVLKVNMPPQTPVPPVTEPTPPVTEPTPPVTEPTPPVTEPTPPVTEPTPPVTEPTPPVTEPMPPVTEPTPPVTETPETEVPNPAPDTEDKPVYRVDIRTEERREVEAFTTSESIDATLPEGAVEESGGQNGEIIRTFEIAQGEDGTILSEKEINVQRVEPVNKVIRRGAVVDRARLQATIAAATAKDAARFTNATFANMNTVLDSSNTVYQTQAITQQQADEAAARIEAAIASLQLLKTKPTLTLMTVDPNELQASAQLNYQLTDSDTAHVRSEVKLYKDGQLVTTQPIEQLQAALNNLDLDVVYEAESILIYDRGNGEEREVSATRTPIELQLKRIELKDIQETTLMKYVDSRLVRVLTLTGQEDASQYVVRVKTPDKKDMLLPVTTFQNEGDAVKVKIQLPQLVQREQDRTFRENYEMTVSKMPDSSANVEAGKQLVTSFAQLLSAVTANPTGNFVLGADVSASEVAMPESAAYIMNAFRGTLTGQFQGKTHTIYDLVKPLFNELQAATVSQLALKEVNIKQNVAKAAPLAITATGATIRDISAEGSVSAQHHVAGIVNEAKNNSRLENVAFQGDLYATTPTESSMNVGGIVGFLEQSTLNKGAVDVNITLTANHGDNRAGGLVGHADYNSARISNSYAKGTLRNVGTGGQVGGAVGSTWQSAHVNDVVSLMNVTNGYTFYGDNNYRNANVRNAFIVDNASAGKTSLYAQSISEADAESKIQGYGITAATDWKTPMASFDYANVQGAQADRTLVYRNMEKLLPFYNREYIVKQGNKVAASSNLATKALVSLVPMQDDRFVTDYYSDKAVINRLLMHFEDGTVEYVNLASGTRFKNSSVYEYQLAGTDLLYTPDQFIQDTSASLNALVTEMSQLDYMDVIAKLFPNHTYTWSMIASQKELMPNKNNTSDADAIAKLKADGVDPLYLSAAFKRVQNNLPHYLNSLIAQALISSTTDANTASVKYVVDKIRNNKEQLIMSLAYIDRLYSIDFDGKNIGDLSMFRQDFLGQKVDALDWLIQLGNSGQSAFNFERNYDTYGSNIGRINGYNTLQDYLDAYRTRLTNKTASDWFKSATKAYVVEKAPQEPRLESVPYDLYNALTKVHHRSLLLPLLTLSDEGIFAISTMSGITFGMYDRYVDMNLAQTNPEEYERKVNEIKAATELEGERERRYFDMWYRLANDNVKQTLLNRSDVPIPTWDGYRLSNNRGWAPAFGENAGERVLEFFGPIGKWYRDNGLGAYAFGNLTHFVYDEVLTQYGSSIYTHEMTHNMDGSIFLGGYQRRKGAGAESYALGMLQSVTTATNQIFGWNMILDHATNNGGRNATDRLHNLHPDRFQNQADLQEYFKGVFDVIYTLDAIEGEAFIKGTDAQKRQVFKTMVMEKDANGEGNDRIRSFTDEEWARLNFTTIADLVNNDVILGLHGNYGDRKVDRNSYQSVLMFVPIYGAITNDTGIAGNLTFKRLTFDILAEKGYEAMLGYTSNKYLAEATSQGAVFSDKYIIQKIFDGKYADFKEFKLDMLTRRLDAAKAGQLKEIEFTYEGKKYTTTYESIKNLIEETAKRNPNHVQRVKEAIYRAYLLDSNDFRDSIYKAQP